MVVNHFTNKKSQYIEDNHSQLHNQSQPEVVTNGFGGKTHKERLNEKMVNYENPFNDFEL